MKNAIKIAIALSIAAAQYSCTPETEEIWDTPSAQRVAQAAADCREVLAGAPNGWNMQLYGNLDFGGYNVLCKFAADGTVTVASEAGKAEETATSHYKIEQSAGIVLSFDGHNSLFHYFSDPVNPDFGSNGRGYEADLEFRIVEATADSVVMTGKKHGARIVMTPLPAETAWADFFTAVAGVEEDMASKQYLLNIGAEPLLVTKADRTLSFTDPATGQVTEMAYIVTPQGIRMYQPVEYGGHTIAGFAYRAGADSYPSTTAGDTLALTKRTPPLTETFVGNYWFASHSGFGATGRKYWDAYAQGEAAVEEEVAYFIFGTYNGKFGITFNSSGYQGQLVYSYSVLAGDRITLSFTGQADSNGQWYYKNAGLNYGMQPFGGKRTFTITTDSAKNPSWLLLTDEADPDNTIKLTAQPVYYPFNN